MVTILFALQTMVRGGVEKELLTILKRFDYSKFDVTVLLLYVADEQIVSEIPHSVNVINLSIDKEYYCSDLVTMIKKRMRSGHIGEALSLTVQRALNIGTLHANQSLDSIPSIMDAYDIAVCYHIHSPIMLKYVATKVLAKKKIGWIHSDFFTTKFPVRNLLGLLSKYDELVSVSNRVKDEFLCLCPNYTGKISTVHNIVDEEEIILLSSEMPDDPYFLDHHVKLLSVGRFSYEKGFDIAIEIANELKNEGIDYRWYLIGYGDEEADYESAIHNYHLEENFLILGKKTNPYPYIANCDIYIQPSRNEAYSITVLEAKALNRPILISDFSGSDEQINNGETGYIVPIKDRKAFLDCLKKMICSKEDRQRLISNLHSSSKNDDDWKAIVDKFVG